MFVRLFRDARKRTDRVALNQRLSCRHQLENAQRCPYRLSYGQSSGMILAPGARGPDFDSLLGSCFARRLSGLVA